MKRIATTQMEKDAARLLGALATMGPGRADLSRDAERYALRLRFALTRLDELKREAADGGAFAAGRADIATTILETHASTAAEFIARHMIDKRRAPKRRSVHVAVEEAVELAERERRAA